MFSVANLPMVADARLAEAASTELVGPSERFLYRTYVCPPHFMPGCCRSRPGCLHQKA